MSQLTPRATHDARVRIRRVATDNPDLTRVSFQASDCLRDSDVIELMEALKQNTHLKVLTLRGLGLTDTSASELLPTVRNHPALEQLDVSQNKLSPRFIASLIEATERKKTCWKLCVERLHEPMTNDQKNLITRKIESNLFLRECIIDIEDEGLKRRIDASLLQNKDRYNNQR